MRSSLRMAVKPLSFLCDNAIMESKSRQIRSYVAPNGKTPFKTWIKGLKDKRFRARILQRIDRLRLGNFGDCRSVGAGVYELRLSFGPGFRVYFGLVESEVVILLCGGDKASQQQDIQKAHQYWQEYVSNAD
jgi:putative addiction module killer protein